MADTLATLRTAAGAYPQRFNKREARLAKVISTAYPYTPILAGNVTTAGGAAAEVITVTGLLATDLVFVQLWQKGATPRTVLTAVPTADTLTVTFSGDPSTDHKLYYQVLRSVP